MPGSNGKREKHFSTIIHALIRLRLVTMGIVSIAMIVTEGLDHEQISCFSLSVTYNFEHFFAPKDHHLTSSSIVQEKS